MALLTEKLKSWRAPERWRRITIIDAHTAGEPLRIITGGFPEIPGDTILEKRRYVSEHLDHLRTMLMWEPRGHADMYGCIITPPVSADADFGVLFTHNEGYSSMCGHGIIGIATVAVQTGMVPSAGKETTVTIDAPAGKVVAIVSAGGKSVRFRNVPSFVLALDQAVMVPEMGEIRYDLAYGGAFYAFVNAEDAGVRCVPQDFAQLVEAGRRIKKAVMATQEIRHPFEEDLGFLYGTIFIAPPRNAAHHSRNVCIFADGEVDRSPTGTGVSARLAIHYAKGEIALGDSIVIESLLGTSFAGRVVETTDFGPHKAVIPEVEGAAYIIGQSEFVVDPDDPLASGFVLR